MLIFLLLCAIGYVGQLFCYFTALNYASSSVVSVLLYTYPALVVIGSAIFLKEKITVQKVISLCLALIGAFVISGVSVLFAVLLFWTGNGITVICVLLEILSILGAFEWPTVQACVPQMQSGDNIIRGNAAVNLLGYPHSLSHTWSVLYVTFRLRHVMSARIICFFLTALFEYFIKLDLMPADN